MKFAIKHEIKGRLRVHMAQQRMTYEQADVLQYYLQQSDLVVDAKVYEQTADVVISYNGDRAAIIHLLCTFKYQLVEVPEGYLESTGRELNAEYKEKLICKVVWHYGKKLILPAPIRNIITVVNGIRYIWKGLQSLRHRRLDVAVLDATGIAVSLLRQDMGTAGSVMFLLGIGELLEEWTHKKSVGDLARSMSLNVEKVWQKVGDQEVLVSSSTIEKGDAIIVHAGNVIPFDGVVTAGDATVNQASLTGESVPVAKTIDSYVYAGTVLEEGELTIRVEATGSATKYQEDCYHDRGFRKTEIQSGRKSRASGRQAGSVYIRWYVTDLVTHKKCHKSIVYPDGRLLMCAEAGNANFCTFCNP